MSRAFPANAANSSVSNKAFPAMSTSAAWTSSSSPAGIDGKFSRLLAQGGFEVSAERVADVVRNVTLKSTVGGPVTIANPWPDSALKVVAKSTGASVPTKRAAHGIVFSTKPGESYSLAPEAKP